MPLIGSLKADLFLKNKYIVSIIAADRALIKDISTVRRLIWLRYLLDIPI